MTLYSSFLIRCWLNRSAPSGASVHFVVEHIQSGEHCNAVDFDAARAWIEEMNAKLAAKPRRDPEEETN